MQQSFSPSTSRKGLFHCVQQNVAKKTTLYVWLLWQLLFLLNQASLSEQQLLGDQPTAFQGRLYYFIGHGSNHTQVMPQLRFDNDTTCNIMLEDTLSTPPPGYPSGTSVEVWGVYDTELGVILVEFFDNITRLNATYTNEEEVVTATATDVGIVAQSVSAPVRVFQVLVMVATGCGSGSTVQGVRSALNSVASMWNSCSYGKLRLDWAGSAIIGPVEVGCTWNGKRYNFNANDCPADGWFDSAQATLRAAARDGGHDPANYPFHVYIMPAVGCWPGVSAVGCYPDCWTMISASYGDQDWVYAHELGHTLGLYHAARVGEPNEYGDCGDPMGCGWANCYNTPHLHQLRWIDTADYGTSNLPRNSAVSVNLPANTLGPATGIRILTEQYVAGSKDRIFLGYLMKSGGNAVIEGAFDNTVTVHIFPEEATFQATVDNWILTQLQATLSVGQTWVHVPSKIRVKYLSSGSGFAQVQLCAYSSGANSCDTMGQIVAGRVARADIQVQLYRDVMYKGSTTSKKFSWLQSDQAKTFSIPNFKNMNMNKRVSSLVVTITTINMGASAATWCNAAKVHLFNAPLTGAQPNRVWSYPAGAFKWTTTGTVCKLSISQMGDANDQTSAMQLTVASR